MNLLPLKTNGPEIPKWVNIISPKSLKTFLSFSYIVSSMFLRDNPINSLTRFSLISIGTKDGFKGSILCPSSFENFWPSPLEPVSG